jgi:hypothetical protein
MDKGQIEKYSSAITLSDMEIFVFPELMYSLVLANIMSPVIWGWRDLETFKKIRKKSSYNKVMRLKQFIMDEYEFNLDLNTWGLTHKDRELERFGDFISKEDIARSNALFGYHGDEYYFDVDIRRHFGLDKYDGDIIPYWKTETVEAMTAFRFKDGYSRGAGECVSLAALYAAAAFVVCEVPLEDIYMVLTPLHSQNFLDVKDGVLTNNRRIVTKTMWFNGSELSNKAQRALRNEQVTIVTHSSGWVHCFYDEATIDRGAYEVFKKKLEGYLETELNLLSLTNFLRCHQHYQPFFQFCTQRRNESMFIPAEVLFHYEHGSKYRIAASSFDKLLDEVDGEDYAVSKDTRRLCCNQLLAFFDYEKIELGKHEHRMKVADYLSALFPDAEEFVNDLASFLKVEPSLPDGNKSYKAVEPISFSVDMGRDGIIDYLKSIRGSNITADLAFYTYRDMGSCDWEPLIKASVERNPVSIEMTKNMDIDGVYDWLKGMSGRSIYDGGRLASPDEAVNYSTADGVEKAFVLANVIKNREPGSDVRIDINNERVVLSSGGRDYAFESAKCFEKKIEI